MTRECWRTLLLPSLPEWPRLWRRQVWILGALCLAGCPLTPTFERPTLSVAGVDWLGGNLLRQEFSVRLHIQNPNDRTLPVSGLHVALSVGGQQIAQGQNDRPFVVPAHGNTDFDMSITADVAAALLQLANRRNQHADSIDYEVNGTANIDLPFFRTLPFHQTGSFALK